MKTQLSGNILQLSIHLKVARYSLRLDISINAYGIEDMSHFVQVVDHFDHCMLTFVIVTTASKEFLASGRPSV